MDDHTDRYRQLFERSGDAILIIEGGSFLECNEASARLFGYSSREDFLRSHPSELSPERQPDGRDSFEKANEMIATAIEKGSHRFEWDHKRVDGTVFPAEVLLTVVHGPDELQLHTVLRDITDRKNLEEQLRHAQKMEAIGKLAGGIAHDFNNILTAVLCHGELLKDYVRDNPTGLDHLENITSAGQRAAELVRQLLTFSRKQPSVTEILDLNQLLLNIAKLLEPTIGEDVVLSTREANVMVAVEANRGQLEQVLMNLVSNARDAMPEGGEISLVVGHELLGDWDPAKRGKLRDGDYSTLSVSDTGIGMDPETISQALDPFFTTKELGKGTGLGLSTAYGIVDRLGGALRISSVPNKGTTVKILLPRTHETFSTDLTQATAKPVRGGEETVLVVEDEAVVSGLIKKILCGAGYQVLLAANGQDGLTLHGQHAARIKLVISDVLMPSMNGPDMVRAIGEHGHTPPVLFISGYSGDTLPNSRRLPKGQTLLEKPFRSEALLRHVRRLLDKDANQKERRRA